jgi:hypothetical protein
VSDKKPCQWMHAKLAVDGSPLKAIGAILAYLFIFAYFYNKQCRVCPALLPL